MSQLATKFIQDDAVTQDKIAAGAVDTSELAADAVDGTRIADDAVNSEHLAAGAVDATALGASAVTHAKLDADVITGATAETSVNGSDEVLIYDASATALRRMTVTNLGLGAGAITLHQEAHVVTSGEVTAGYFALSQSPVNAAHVRAFVVGGIPQVNKQAVGASGATPDFDILNTNQFHFNNTVATGLSEIIVEGDVVMIQYGY